MNEEFIPPDRKGFSVGRELYDWVESAITAVLCVVLVFTFVARMVGVVGSSMVPTLEDQDRLVITRITGQINAGDIVVITKPNTKNEPLIKRVIATEGQTIDIDPETGAVYIDGKQISEPYIAEMIRPEALQDFKEAIVVPRGCVFAMGDNRNNSWDSRSAVVGAVDTRYILGKVIFRVTPYQKFGPPDSQTTRTEQ